MTLLEERGADTADMVVEENSTRRGHDFSLRVAGGLSTEARPDPAHETSAPPAPSSDLLTPRTEFTLEALEEGFRRLQAVLAARQLRARNVDWKTIEAQLGGYSYSYLCRLCARVAHLPNPTAAGLAPPPTPIRARPVSQATPQDMSALQANYLVTNRTENCGSAEEAARMALRKNQLSPDLAARLRARADAGQPILPQALRRDVILPASVVRQYRNPTEAGLDYLSCPGSLKFVTDRHTGEKRFARAGDLLEMDDATINFPVCVPWDRAGLPGQPCADKYGVIVGRFQWLVCIDVGELYVPGWSYTARPRSSYRGEDIAATLHTVFAQHGIWQRARFERGTFESDLVTRLLKQLRVDLITVHSPHTKAFIEGLFNLLWTKLSDMPGQVGRFQGEMEEENALVEKCRKGAHDPRRYFPMLSPAIEALSRVVAERNAQWVHSTNYGDWVPEKRWAARRDEGRLTPLDPGSAWLFSPCVRTWTVDGCQVGGSVRYCEGLSVRYDFSSAALAEFDHRQVEVYFDPFAPRCAATIVLKNDTSRAKAGTVICTAPQVNAVAQYARRMFGYGDDADIGLEVTKRNAQAMRRDVRTVLPGGRSGAAVSTQRDGEGQTLVIETGLPQSKPALRARSGLEAPTPDQFRRKTDRFAALTRAYDRVGEGEKDQP